MKEFDLIYKHALANAYAHKGKASAGAVIGRVLGEKPELKSKIKELQKEISEIVSKVNSMTLEEQGKELKKVYPEFFEKKEVKKGLPELPNAEVGKVVTRLAPEPNGYLHIGHAVSFYFNYYYAKKYKGKLILRFEDTNPEKEKKEFYDSAIEDLKWLGIEYDLRKNNSDDIELFYKYAEKLISSGDAYVCTCPVEKIRKLRFEGKACECRSNSVEKNLELWRKMREMPPGAAVLRLKGDLKAKNAVMRDPTLFRIVDAEHPLQGEKYRVWPLYDFANAIEDSICGVTHVLRSNEFLQRNELQNKIRELLGLRSPEIISYSRVKVEGTPTSKREIRELMEKSIVKSWDDPRLVTIKALKRRGILPEAIKEIAKEVRMTSGSTTIDWKSIAGINSKFLDEIANRYFFVPDPVKLEVKNAPAETAQLKMHPNHPERGVRKVKTSGIFYISKQDKFKKGEIFRLKDLYNVRYLGNGKAEFAGKNIIPKTQKIQWVTEENVDAEVIVPGILIKEGKINKDSLKIVKGLAESSCNRLQLSATVQFERFGFVKLDKKKKDKLVFILTHK